MSLTMLQVSGCTLENSLDHVLLQVVMTGETEVTLALNPRFYEHWKLDRWLSSTSRTPLLPPLSFSETLSNIKNQTESRELLILSCIIDRLEYPHLILKSVSYGFRAFGHVWRLQDNRFALKGAFVFA